MVAARQVHTHGGAPRAWAFPELVLAFTHVSPEGLLSPTPKALGVVSRVQKGLS